ncbi:hypothetical protein EJB05_51756, partial [Eragrostis curvula]
MAPPLGELSWPPLRVSAGDRPAAYACTFCEFSGVRVTTVRLRPRNAYNALSCTVTYRAMTVYAVNSASTSSTTAANALTMDAVAHYIHSIYKSFMAGATVSAQDVPPEQCIDPARGEALGTSKTRRLREVSRHAEVRSHASEADAAQVPAPAVLGHVLGVEHPAAEELPHPRHERLPRLRQRLPVGEHLYEKRQQSQ